MTVTQAAFREAVLNPELPTPKGLTDPKGRPAGKRFDVYRNNVVVSLSDGLAEAFPVVAKLVGPANFRILAGQFVRKHPPGSPLMMFYGSEMPEFLRGFAPVQGLGYLPDVARLELALRHSYHAADAETLDPQVLATIPADRLADTRFRVAPSVRLIQSDWPIVAIWRFNTEGGPKPSMQPEAALITRSGFDPEITALPPADAAFVATLLEGRPLGEAVDAGAARDPAFDPSAPLGTLVAQGALTDLTEDNNP